MSTLCEATALRWTEQRTGSHAAYEPSYWACHLEFPQNAWGNVWVQSSAISPSGVAWSAAILDALASESETITRLQLHSVAAPRFVSTQVETEPERVRRAIALLDEWLSDQSGYDEETWPQLKEALDRNRLSGRRLF
jgi:hypothetical protein